MTENTFDRIAELTRRDSDGKLLFPFGPVIAEDYQAMRAALATGMKTFDEKNPPAFPFSMSMGKDGHVTNFGMSLRSWFAGMALASGNLMDMRDIGVPSRAAESERVAGTAVAIADALIAELEKSS